MNSFLRKNNNQRSHMFFHEYLLKFFLAACSMPGVMLRQGDVTTSKKQCSMAAILVSWLWCFPKSKFSKLKSEHFQNSEIASHLRYSLSCSTLQSNQKINETQSRNSEGSPGQSTCLAFVRPWALSYWETNKQIKPHVNFWSTVTCSKSNCKGGKMQRN